MADGGTEDNTLQGIRLLKSLDPVGVHNLVAIDPETKAVEGYTFPPDAWDRMRAWISARNGRLNLYFSLNEPAATAPHGKLSKGDIASIRAVSVDLDPRGDADLAQERNRLLSLADEMSARPNRPTHAVDSGGGVQLFWLLEEKLPAGEHRAWAEAQGRGLAALLGGDHTQNIDRVMRLPGTLNLPDERKRKLGRIPAAARLLHDTAARYSRDQLIAIAEPRALSPHAADSDAKVAAVIGGLDFDAVSAAEEYAELPDDLRRRFDAACARDPDLAWLWRDGDEACLIGCDDVSGSAFRGSLAAHLNRVGGFGPQDFGSLLWVWPHALQGGDREVKITARQIARDWVRVGMPRDTSGEFVNLDAGAAPAQTARPSIYKATPFVWIEPARIPRREWLYGRHYVSRYLSATVAPGGVGKTSLTIAEALAMASGRDILAEGSAGPRRPLRIWLWNGEDPQDEMQRRIAAAMIGHRLNPFRVAGNLFVDSGRDQGIRIASTEKGTTRVAQPVIDTLARIINENRISVLIVDPFVSSHGVPENDNGAIDMVAKAYAGIADATGCAIELVHHLRKTNGAEATAEDARGAVSLIAAARSVRVLNAMPKADGARIGIGPDECFRYVRVDDGKANLAPRDKARWRKLVSVNLGNATMDEPGDSVGVMTAWEWPAVEALPGLLTVDELRAVKLRVAAGRWREHPQSKDWVGLAIADALGWSRDERARLRSLVEGLLATGALRVEIEKDEQRKTRTFVVVGEAEEALQNEVFDPFK